MDNFKEVEVLIENVDGNVEVTNILIIKVEGKNAQSIEILDVALRKPVNTFVLDISNLEKIKVSTVLIEIIVHDPLNNMYFVNFIITQNYLVLKITIEGNVNIIEVGNGHDINVEKIEDENLPEVGKEKDIFEDN